METRGYKQNRVVIMLVALAGMSVYLLPYFRYYYYDAYVSYFGINDLQMGTLGSIYGVLAIVGVAGILYTPRSMKFMWMLIISIALLCMFMYSAQALHYAVLEEGEYPVEIMGAVTFIISPLGYSAESIMPLYNGWCLNHFSGLEGYEMIFKTFIGMLCIAIVAIIIFRKLTKERRMELAEMRKKGEEAS